MRAMAELGAAPQKAADVAALLDRTSPQVAPTRAELIAMGLLYTHEHGYDAFTVPHFESLMRRAMPDLQSRRFDAAAPRLGARHPSWPRSAYDLLLFVGEPAVVLPSRALSPVGR